MNTESVPAAAPHVTLACVPGAIPAAERPVHFALISRLFGEEAREKRDLPDGYAFRFEADAFDEVARFVANERKCCPFLTFALELSPGAGSLWLRLGGPPGTREFLDLELPPTREPLNPLGGGGAHVHRHNQHHHRRRE